MKAALVSLPLFEKQVKTNIENIRQVINDSRNDGIDLYVFAENNIAGGFWKSFPEGIEEVYQAFPFSIVAEEIASISDEFNTGICCGYLEKEDGFFITHFICNKGMNIGKQRKLFPQNPLKEKYLESGTSITNIDWNGCRVHILACCNFCFPEVAVMSCIQQPDIIVCPTDTYFANEHEINVISTYLNARALDSGAYVLCSLGNPNAESGKLISAAAYNGKGEQLLFKVQESNDVQVSIIEFEPARAKQVWGGSSMRQELLLSSLQSSMGLDEQS